MTYEVKNKVVLITGAASGIGALVAIAFVKEGARYVAILDIAKEEGVALEKELNKQYGVNKAKFIQCDVTDETQLNNAYATLINDNGSIDLVINNAGIMNDSPKLYRKEIAVNVTALVTSTLKAIDLMRKNRGGNGGAVINISSIAALCQMPALPVYMGTKSAVLQFSNCIGQEPHYGRTGVRVITLCFGPTDTPLLYESKTESIDKETTDELYAILKSGPLQRPESAVRGVVEAFKKGISGSTWLAIDDKDPQDITEKVNEAYDILSSVYI